MIAPAFDQSPHDIDAAAHRSVHEVEDGGAAGRLRFDGSTGEKAYLQQVLQALGFRPPPRCSSSRRRAFRLRFITRQSTRAFISTKTSMLAIFRAVASRSSRSTRISAAFTTSSTSPRERSPGHRTFEPVHELSRREDTDGVPTARQVGPARRSRGSLDSFRRGSRGTGCRWRNVSADGTLPVRKNSRISSVMPWDNMPTGKFKR